jgi:hypothetical protein
MSVQIPATYSDIGKSASDLFSKDFPVGTFKLESKTVAPNGVVSSQKTIYTLNYLLKNIIKQMIIRISNFFLVFHSYWPERYKEW